MNPASIKEAVLARLGQQALGAPCPAGDAAAFARLSALHGFELDSSVRPLRHNSGAATGCENPRSPVPRRSESNPATRSPLGAHAPPPEPVMRQPQTRTRAEVDLALEGVAELLRSMSTQDHELLGSLLPPAVIGALFAGVASQPGAAEALLCHGLRSRYLKLRPRWSVSDTVQYSMT